MKLFEELEKQLKQEPNFTDDIGKLKKWEILSKAQDYNADLIELLLENETLKQTFFVEVKGVLVFKSDKFCQFLEQKNFLNDSYTQYKNKVGLTIGNKYLKQQNDITLVWPFKDCILEGGQSREEDRREEIFFNQTLAQDEISQLLDPKVLTNAQRYTADNQSLTGGGKTLITRDLQTNQNRHLPENTITDNLIIKGNNLLALHSLKKEFAQKIKLIYIDPPYNTGNDGFKYNDRFNHSSWLTFMKNRLEIARTLLKDDGVIFVQCDDNEQAYLKVLMDEIFGRENFVNCIIPLMNPRGRQESAYPLAKSHEYILIYSKKEDCASFYNFGVIENKMIDDSYRLLSLRKSGNASLRKDRPNMFYPIYCNLNTEEIYTEKRNIENEVEIFPIKTDGVEGRWRWQKSNVENNSNLLVCKKNSKGIYDIYVKDFLIKDGVSKGIKTNTFLIDTNIINDKAKEHLEELFENKEIFSYPKSEYLIQRIIEISTQPNDIVLDFHLGSGTTAAVAHKMGRQYIGIEQMDYIESVAVERLKKVIAGEQGGISKAVNWQGGGSFLYFELKKYNQNFIDQIQNAQNTEELLQIWEVMKQKSFLAYNVDIQKLNKEIEDFKTLDLDNQKQFLCEILDKNQIYVNLSSLNDEDFQCNEEEKAFNREFYTQGVN